ncbi:PIG-L family deacetylase [Mesonia ostreae]|uniref:PIG-L family deacetylase n=1 Tax=Mesonia ostreae TaxID=861110 RepID=A0ABU2KJT3_9FLAO|nr:PIG-L family deacetylase [Mesonia ostreae]MDT0294975.1 PIG-L family deacetylase [Mesonia ostreae]
MKKYAFVFLILLSNFTFYGQKPPQLNSSEIYQQLEKLDFLGSVLYIAAHPDDENTKLISYFSNQIHANTAYLSLTRGDGGQNLIGSELREKLGLIRTQELLAARRIDGGKQFFTRANDFGYSKTPQETLAIWNKEKVLNDVVKSIRKFQPDVIINRFDHRTEGNTHGHHTASARLSLEAFAKAADKNYASAEAKTLGTWQPQRLFFNTSWWFYGSQEKFDSADKSKMLAIDAGVYNPLIGISNSEIASHSRSQHKSQGFGNTPVRGEQLEYIELIEGNPIEGNSVFEGINTTWTRVKGGKEIGVLIAKIKTEYDFKTPSKSVKDLVKVYRLIEKIENKHWRDIKLQETKNLIAACSGLYLEAVTETALTTPGETLFLQIEATQRLGNSVLKEIAISNSNFSKKLNTSLNPNQKVAFKEEFTLPANTPYTNPYWLKKPSGIGMYEVENKDVIGLPETPPTLIANFSIEIEGETLTFEKELVYKYNDPVEGEVYEPFQVVPTISVSIEKPILIFGNEKTKVLPIHIKTFSDKISGRLKLDAPNHWKIEYSNEEIQFSKKGEEKIIYANITPPNEGTEDELIASFIISGKTYQQNVVEIDYEHIPKQILLEPANAKLIALDIKKKGDKIAYIEGAGDVVPESLREIGYQVSVLTPSQISLEKLKAFDAVVMGIRAYNTVNELAYKQEILFAYVKQGGNMIVQYNTNRGLVTQDLTPYSLQLSRDRVTDEFSDVKFLAKKHPVLNSPNKITSKDFENWVQERGLYFPGEWDKEHFTPILSLKEKGESWMDGSLLVASYGKGNYIYTGLSFFREFPAGVSGSYRLFANLISLGK